MRGPAAQQASLDFFRSEIARRSKAVVSSTVGCPQCWDVPECSTGEVPAALASRQALQQGRLDALGEEPDSIEFAQLLADSKGWLPDAYGAFPPLAHIVKNVECEYEELAAELAAQFPGLAKNGLAAILDAVLNGVESGTDADDDGWLHWVRPRLSSVRSGRSRYQVPRPVWKWYSSWQVRKRMRWCPTTPPRL